MEGLQVQLIDLLVFRYSCSTCSSFERDSGSVATIMPDISMMTVYIRGYLERVARASREYH